MTEVIESPGQDPHWDQQKAEGNSHFFQNSADISQSILTSNPVTLGGPPISWLTCPQIDPEALTTPIDLARHTFDGFQFNQ